MPLQCWVKFRNGWAWDWACRHVEKGQEVNFWWGLLASEDDCLPAPLPNVPGPAGWSSFHRTPSATT